jgi:hypothetical protein
MDILSQRICTMRGSEFQIDLEKIFGKIKKWK